MSNSEIFIENAEGETVILNLKSDTLKAGWYMIDSDIAEQLLENNLKNRQITIKKIIDHSYRMQTNLFKVNGQGLSFDVEGNLQDGQHRLLSIIKSKKCYPFVIATGIPTDAMPTYDTGKNRSIGDVFSLYGIPNHVTLSAAIMGYLKRNKGILGHMNIDTKIYATDCLNEYNTRPDFWKGLLNASSKIYKQNSIFSRSTLTGCAAYFHTNFNYDVNFILSYFEILLRLETTNNPILKKLQTLFHENAMPKNKAKLTSYAISYYLYFGFNEYILNTGRKTVPSPNNFEKELPAIVKSNKGIL